MNDPHRAGHVRFGTTSGTSSRRSRAHRPPRNGHLAVEHGSDSVQYPASALRIHDRLKQVHHRFPFRNQDSLRTWLVGRRRRRRCGAWRAGKCVCPLLGFGGEEFSHGGGVGVPALLVVAEAAAAFGGEAVVLGAAIVVGEAPLGFDPALFLHAVESGVERAFLGQEGFVGRLLDGRDDGVAVEKISRGNVL